jgi:RNA polymerase sigma-70 factor (ECF subfamily)
MGKSQRCSIKPKLLVARYTVAPKQKSVADLVEETAREEVELFVRAFEKAMKSGRFEPFIKLLTEDTVLISDGGGKVRAAIFPIMGKDRVRAFLEGISAKGGLQGELHPAWINGQKGILLMRPHMPLRPFVSDSLLTIKASNPCIS